MEIGPGPSKQWPVSAVAPFACRCTWVPFSAALRLTQNNFMTCCFGRAGSLLRVLAAGACCRCAACEVGIRAVIRAGRDSSWKRSEKLWLLGKLARCCSVDKKDGERYGKGHEWRRKRDVKPRRPLMALSLHRRVTCWCCCRNPIPAATATARVMPMESDKANRETNKSPSCSSAQVTQLMALLHSLISYIAAVFSSNSSLVVSFQPCQYVVQVRRRPAAPPQSSAIPGSLPLPLFTCFLYTFTTIDP